MPLDVLAQQMSPGERTAVQYFRAPVARDRLNVRLDSAAGLPHRIFSYAAHLVLVEVDELTGHVAPMAYLAVTDAGRILNPDLYHGQIQGGIVQGLGYALTEDYRVEDGLSLTPNLTTYIIPTARDVPDMVTLAVETHERTGPFGLKGLGKITMAGPLPAVANAVADACGRHVRGAPLIPERVMEALAKKRD